MSHDRNINLQTLAGNIVQAEFAGHQFGLLQGVNMGDDYGLQPSSGVGDARVVEWVPGMATHTVTADFMISRRDFLINNGLVPNSARHDDLQSALKGFEFDITIRNKQTGARLRTYRGCALARFNTRVTKHAIVLSDCQFMARDVSDNNL